MANYRTPYGWLRCVTVNSIPKAPGQRSFVDRVVACYCGCAPSFAPQFRSKLSKGQIFGHTDPDAAEDAPKTLYGAMMAKTSYSQYSTRSDPPDPCDVTFSYTGTMTVNSELPDPRYSTIATASASGNASGSFSYSCTTDCNFNYPDLGSRTNKINSSYSSNGQLDPALIFEGFAKYTRITGSWSRQRSGSSTYCSDSKPTSYSKPTSGESWQPVGQAETVKTYTQARTIADAREWAASDMAGAIWVAGGGSHGIDCLKYRRLWRFNYHTDEAFANAITAATEDAEGVLAAREAAVTYMEGQITIAEEKVVTAKAQLADNSAAFFAARAAAIEAAPQQRDWSIEQMKLGNSMLYDTTLDDTDRDALQDQIGSLGDQIEAAIADLDSAYPSFLRDEQDVASKKAALASVMERMARAEYTATEAAKLVVAASGNISANYYSAQYTPHNATSVEVNSHGTTLYREDSDYRFRAYVGNLDLTAGSTVVLKWRERLRRIADFDEDAGNNDETTYKDMTETVSLTGDTDTSYIATEWKALASVPDNFARDIVGIKVRLTVSVRSVASQGGTESKVGFRGYLDEDMPSIYKRETYTGGYAGCGDAPEVNFAGVRYYEDYHYQLDGPDYDGYVADPPPLRNYILRTEGEEGWDALIAGDGEWPSDFVLQPNAYGPGVGKMPATFKEGDETATTRSWEDEVACGDDAISRTLTTTLSEEYTTGELRARVDALIGAEWEDSQSYGRPPLSHILQEGSANGGAYGAGNNLGVIASNYLSADELTYSHQVTRWKVQGYALQHDDDNSQSVPYEYKHNVMDVTTGIITVTDKSGKVPIEAGSSNGETDDLILTAGYGEVVWITNLKSDLSEHQYSRAIADVEVQGKAPIDR